MALEEGPGVGIPAQGHAAELVGRKLIQIAGSNSVFKKNKSTIINILYLAIYVWLGMGFT